jgi:hypothetical protein
MIKKEGEINGANCMGFENHLQSEENVKLKMILSGQGENYKQMKKRLS